MKKKAVMVVVGLLVVFGVAAGVFTMLDKKKDDKKKDDASAFVDPNTVKGIDTTSVDEIKKKYTDPNQLYASLMSSGSISSNSKKYSEAITYYQAAASSTDSQDRKDEANIAVYYAAKVSGDSKLENEYKQLLGSKLEQTFKRAGNDVDGQ